MTGAVADAVIVAAGRGQRLGGAVPKQFLPLGRRAVVARALAPFLAHPAIRRVVAVIGEDDGPTFAEAVEHHERLAVVRGGASRVASVRAALDELAGDPPRDVLIHDGARPFVTAAVIDRVLEALTDAVGAVPAVPVADTLKRVEAGTIAATIDRAGLFQAQTPQGFRFATLAAAHATAPAGVTDDAGALEAAGHDVIVVEGERANYKITTPDDLALARAGLAAYPAVGNGFDVHRLVPGGPLILGGLTIDHDARLDGHSDADVALHALTDALFGAIGEGDIGHHFPPTEARWRGAASDTFLAFAATRARARGTIAHLDLTIICERPKIGPLREAMRARIAEICSVEVARVSVKATTTERLGFTGRGEGIAAQASATVLVG